MLTSTDARGNQAQYFYDDLDRLTSTIDALGNTSSSEYDAADNLIASIDELGLQSDYEFDALDRLFRATDPLGRQYLTAYDAMDNVLLYTDAKGNETEYDYDALYRQTGLTDALDNFFATAYDANDNIVSTTDARGFTTLNSFDALDRMVLSTDPIGNTMGYVFDAADNLLQSIDELGFITQHTYDALDRRTSTESPVGGIWQTDYDAAGNVILETDAVGNQTAYTLDALDRVTAVTDARGGVTLMLYDADSNLVATTDSVGNVTGFTYDAISRKTSEIDPLGETMTYEYDAASRMTAQVDRLGRRREFVFDDGYRIVQEIWKDDLGAVVETFGFTFDDNDNLLTATDSDGTITSTYDALDRLVTQTDVWSKTLTYAYDEVSNVVSTTDSEGGVETSAYDGLNRLTRRDFTDGVAELRLDITYTPRSEIATQTRYADLAGTTQIGSTQFVYDGNGRTSSIDHLDGLGASLESLAYTYDVADRLTSEDRNGNVRTYDYDATNQLIDDTDNQYEYDLNGNRAPMPGYVVGAGNRLQSDGVWTYTYNAEGNRVTKTHIVDDEEWTYEYDHNNHLTVVEHRDVVGTLLLRVDIRYDALGRRIEVVTDELGTGVTVERYAHAGDDIWADLDVASSLTTRYIHGNRIDEHYARVDQAGVVDWYLTDRLGSTVAIADNTGALATQITYDGFGNVLTNSTPSESDRYLFTGREFFFQISLQHNRDRWYDPATGSWISEDRLRGEDTNPYRYVGNNATNAIDPRGTDDILGIGGAFMDFADSLATVRVNATQRFKGALQGNFQPRIVRGVNNLAAIREEATGRFKGALQGNFDPTIVRGVNGLAAIREEAVARFKGALQGNFDPKIIRGVNRLAAERVKLFDKAMGLLEGRVDPNFILGSKLAWESLKREIGAIPSKFEGLLKGQIDPRFRQGLTWFRDPDNLQTSLDVLGTVDPTPILDTINGLIYGARGNYAEAGLSLISAFPFFGDFVGKGGKILNRANDLRKVKCLDNAIDDARALKKLLQEEREVAEEFRRIYGHLDPSNTKPRLLGPDGKPFDGKVVLPEVKPAPKKQLVDGSGRPIHSNAPAGERDSLPPWLKERFEAGEAFNKANRGRYLYNEVEVIVKGKTYRVDSLNPGEIVSRRLTQLADVQGQTAIGYFSEFTRKYPAGATITNSPFNPAALRGKTLTGDLIFEVPVQTKPIPQAVLDAATQRNIKIRDVAGKVYNP